MADATAILEALEMAGLRLTGPRRELADLLTEQAGHFTSGELVSETKRRRLGVGRATVFRTLDALEELGLVERIDLPSGEHAYVTCERPHHHHVVCSNCGRTSEIDDAGLKTVVHQIARRTGYRVDIHRLELFGLCPACQAARAAPSTASA